MKTETGLCIRCGRMTYNPKAKGITILHLWRAKHWTDKVICTECADEELESEKHV